MTTDIAQPVEILSEQQCWTLLHTAEVGRLAVSIMNQPDVFPLNFVVDKGTVVFRTAEGTKLAAAVLGRGVAFEADGYEADEGVAWSVVIKGRAAEIENMYELFDVGSLPLFPWHNSPKYRYVRITPFEITGRRFVVSEPSTGE